MVFIQFCGSEITKRHKELFQRRSSKSAEVGDRAQPQRVPEGNKGHTPVDV